MAVGGVLLLKKYKYIDIMVYRNKAECFILPGIIYGFSNSIYKPSIGITWLRTNVIVYFNNK